MSKYVIDKNILTVYGGGEYDSRRNRSIEALFMTYKMTTLSGEFFRRVSFVLVGSAVIATLGVGAAQAADIKSNNAPSESEALTLRDRPDSFFVAPGSVFNPNENGGIVVGEICFKDGVQVVCDVGDGTGVPEPSTLLGCITVGGLMLGARSRRAKK